MRQLNLLPQRIKNRERERGRLAAVLLAVLLAAAAVSGGYLYLQQQVSQATADLASAQGQLDAVRQKAGQAVQSDPATRDAVARITQLNLLYGQDVPWDALFSQAAQAVPAGLRLTTLAAVSSGGAVSVSENGTAPSTAAFTSFDDAMGKRQDLGSFTVGSYAYVPSDGSVSFSVSYSVPLGALSGGSHE
jgi:Tfp pilus assembly protein PilN